MDTYCAGAQHGFTPPRRAERASPCAGHLNFLGRPTGRRAACYLNLPFRLDRAVEARNPGLRSKHAERLAAQKNPLSAARSLPRAYTPRHHGRRHSSEHIIRHAWMEPARAQRSVPMRALLTHNRFAVHARALTQTWSSNTLSLLLFHLRGALPSTRIKGVLCFFTAPLAVAVSVPGARAECHECARASPLTLLRLVCTQFSMAARRRRRACQRINI